MIGKGGSELVVRIEDQHAQARIGADGAVQQQRYRRRLADTGRAHDREMLRQHRGNVDGGVDAFVLGQLADDAGIGLAGIVDAHQVGGTDAVGDGAEIGIAGDAGREMLAAIGEDLDLAEQFHLDAELVVLTLDPVIGAGLHRIGQRHDAVRRNGNRDQAADGP